MKRARDLAVLALDPGITTGWALVTQEGILWDCGNWRPEDLDSGLDGAVRAAHAEGFTLDVVQERVPPGPLGRLATDLEYVRRTIAQVLDVYMLDPAMVLPVTWKPSRAAHEAELPRKWDGQALTEHQKDAVRMAHWYLAQQRAAGRPRGRAK